MKFKFSAIAAAVAAATLSVGASAAPVDFHGYLRSGIGSNSEGGKQTCVGLEGAGSKYRLGNECETYGELELGANLYEQGNTKAGVHVMQAYVVDQNGDWETFAPSWRQAYADISGVGTGALATATFWVGKRYYKRSDVHLNDFFYDNNSGPGAGMADLDVGFGKFSYALLRRANNASETQSDHDFRLEGIQTNENGSIDLNLQVSFANNNGDVGKDNEGGFSAQLRHNQSGILGGGWNKAVFQYASGANNLDGSAYPSTSDRSQWRVLDRLFFNYGAWDGEAIVLYQSSETGKNKAGEENTRDWFSIGVRPVYHFDNVFSIATELGYDMVTDSAPEADMSEDRSLLKATIAAQMSAGKSYWSRPTLRAFASYFSWSGDEGKKSAYGVDAFGKNADNGFTYGFQMEAWW